MGNKTQMNGLSVLVVVCRCCCCCCTVRRCCCRRRCCCCCCRCCCCFFCLLLIVICLLLLVGFCLFIYVNLYCLSFVHVVIATSRKTAGRCHESPCSLRSHHGCRSAKHTRPGTSGWFWYLRKDLWSGS